MRRIPERWEGLDVILFRNIRAIEPAEAVLGARRERYALQWVAADDPGGK